jgi:hypothetical protein
MIKFISTSPIFWLLFLAISSSLTAEAARGSHSKENDGILEQDGRIVSFTIPPSDCTKGFLEGSCNVGSTSSAAAARSNLRKPRRRGRRRRRRRGLKDKQAAAFDVVLDDDHGFFDKDIPHLTGCKVGTFDVTTTVVDTCTTEYTTTVDNITTHVQEETIEIQVSDHAHDDDLGGNAVVIIATVGLTVEVTQKKSATTPNASSITATVSAVKMTVKDTACQKEEE